MASATLSPDKQALRHFLYAGGVVKETPTASDLEEKGRPLIDRLISTGNGAWIIEEVKSANGRCCKEYTLLYTLAVCLRSNNPPVAKEVCKCLQEICQTPSSLFLFLKFSKEILQQVQVNQRLCFGRQLRRAVGKWYTDNPRFKENILLLAVYITKYKQRYGWSHRMVLKATHPKPPNAAYNYIFRYVVRGFSYAERKLEEDERDANLCCTNEGVKHNVALLREFLKDVKTLHQCQDEDTACEILKKHSGNLTWEQLPCRLHKSVPVWNVLLSNTLPMTALLRKLGLLSSLDVLQEMNEEWVCQRLENADIIGMSRLHPNQVLKAISQYRHGVSGKGHKPTSNIHWSPSDKLLSSLQTAFFLTLGNVRSTRKRLLVAINVNSSMDQCVAGSSNVKCKQVAVAYALFLHRRTYYNVTVVTFNGEPFPITAEDNIDTVLTKINQVTADTDYTGPFTYARSQNSEVDAFILMTNSFENEQNVATVRGMFEQYSNPSTKLVTIGLSSQDVCAAHGDNPNILDVIGLDSCVFQDIGKFICGDEGGDHEDMEGVVLYQRQ